MTFPLRVFTTLLLVVLALAMAYAGYAFYGHYQQLVAEARMGAIAYQFLASPQFPGSTESRAKLLEDLGLAKRGQ